MNSLSVSLFLPALPMVLSLSFYSIRSVWFVLTDIVWNFPSFGCHFSCELTQWYLNVLSCVFLIFSYSQFLIAVSVRATDKNGKSNVEERPIQIVQIRCGRYTKANK